MAVKLTDKVYNEGGSPVQGAVAQAVLTNGTTTAVQATDTTDIKGIWAFDSSIAGHQADLPDPASGYWYDVRINVGMQYRLRYGAIKAMMSMVYLAQNIVLGAGQVFDATLAALKLPSSVAAPGTPGTGSVYVDTTQARLRVYIAGAWHTVVQEDGGQAISMADPVITGQVVLGTGVQTLPTATGNAGKWRYYKAWGGAATITPFTGESIVHPGTTSQTTTPYSSPNGESTGWYCHSNGYWYCI